MWEELPHSKLVYIQSPDLYTAVYGYVSYTDRSGVLLICSSELEQKPIFMHI